MSLSAYNRITLEKFKNDSDFLKVANVLNHIVDTKRLFGIISIDAYKSKFYSLTDEGQTIITKPTKDVLIYEKHKAKPLSEKHIKQLNQKSTVVYQLHISNGKHQNKFVIADENFIPLDDEPENRDAISIKYAQAFVQHQNKYNYVSLENVVPINDKFVDLLNTNDDDLLFPISKYSQNSIPNVKTNLWGVRQDPKFDCNYDITKKSISFDFNASDGEYRSFTIMDNFLKYYEDTEIRMSTIDDFTSKAMQNVEEFPQIIQCMYHLYLKTNVDFTIKLTNI